MNMAELRYLQDAIGDSLAFWRECKDQFFLLFMDGPRFSVENASPCLLGRALHLVKRLMRFMLCFDGELNKAGLSPSPPLRIGLMLIGGHHPVTGKQNLMLIDAYLWLERELEHARKRTYNLRLPTDADAANALSQVSPPSSLALPSPSLLLCLTGRSVLLCHVTGGTPYLHALTEAPRPP